MEARGSRAGVSGGAAGARAAATSSLETSADGRSGNTASGVGQVKEVTIRRTGIQAIGDAPWGTHFCQFYQTREDLVDILVPYFAAGLEDNEFCMWVTSAPLGVDEARKALAGAVKDLDRRIATGQMEIIDYRQWYTKTGGFDADAVLAGWVEKEKEALRRGFEGLRLTGNTFWLDKKDWAGFRDYEAAVNGVIGRHRMIAICTYSLEKCGAPEVFDVVRNHQFALVRQEGRWRIIESGEQGRTEAALRQAEVFEAFFRHSVTPLAFLDKDFNFIRVNEAYAEAGQRDVSEFPGHNHFEFYPSDAKEIFEEVVRTKKPYQVSARPFVYADHPEWGVTYWDWSLVPVLDAEGEVDLLVYSLKDVTESRRVEAVSQQLAALVESSADAIVGKTLDGTIVSWNQAAARLYGYSAAEAVGRHVSMLDAPDHPDDLPEIRERIRKGGRVEYYETVRIAKDGRRIDVSMSVSPIRNAAGEIIGASSIARDITEHKAMENRLRAASLYARTLIEASLDPLVTISPEGKITDVNEATELATGVPRAKLVGSDFSDYFTEPEKARAGYRKVISDGSVRDYALTIRHASGRTTDVLYNATLFRNEAGEVQGVFAAARDVTVRKRMEDQLRAASLYARSLIEVSPDPLVTISHEGKITDVNEATELATGVARQKLVGTDFSDYFTEGDKARAGYRQVISEGFVRDYPLTIRHASGRTMDVLYNAALYKNEAGEVEGVFAAARDVTQRKLAEAELTKYREHLEELVKQRTAELESANKRLEAEIAERERSEAAVRQRTVELEAANRELEAFAYSVSHDLRAPLRSINGFSQALLDDYGPMLDDGGQEYLRRVCGASQRMGQLIDDLLKLSRITRVEMRRERVSLSEAARALASELMQSQPDRRVDFAIEEGVTAYGDGQLLRTAMGNLLDNAWKFTGNRPSARIEFGVRQEEDGPVYYVRDDGAGFDMAYADKLFLPFQRLHSSEEFPGTGVGLATVQRIIQRHGGRIWAEGALGIGATFHFTLSQ